MWDKPGEFGLPVYHTIVAADSLGHLSGPCGPSEGNSEIFSPLEHLLFQSPSCTQTVLCP